MARIAEVRIGFLADVPACEWRARVAIAANSRALSWHMSGDGSVEVIECHAAAVLGRTAVDRFVQRARGALERRGRVTPHVSSPRATVLPAGGEVGYAFAIPLARWHYIYPIAAAGALIGLGDDKDGYSVEVGTLFLHDASQRSRVQIGLVGGQWACVLDGVIW